MNSHTEDVCFDTRQNSAARRHVGTPRADAHQGSHIEVRELVDVNIVHPHHHGRACKDPTRDTFSCHFDGRSLLVSASMLDR